MNTPQLDNAGNWIPTAGLELGRFLSLGNRPIEMQSRIQREAISVLGGCTDPRLGGANTGLVLGRVQSGKTSSFTAVSALAHDNGYKIIIIIAGTSHLLVEQTTERLQDDLGLTQQNAYQRWVMCAVSARDQAKELAGLSNLKVRMQALHNDANPLWAGIPIVIVMKNKTALMRLNNLFTSLVEIEGIDLAKFPALIIDDEAHMHSPDVGSDESPSTVYECMRSLAGNFPNRSILQYTATPQANLLMEIANEMSPDFVRLLEPGLGYVGGKELFTTSPNPRIRDIDPGEFSNNPIETDPAPASLIDALINFLLVCAIDYKVSNVANPRSMLIHSDQKVNVHKVYEHWISTLVESWRGLFADSDYRLPDQFARELDDLKKTNQLIEEHNLSLEILRPIIIQVMTALRIQSVNHKSDVGKVNFNLAPYWIINGGNILGVGYTVVGLVTTHMIRKPGAGMADTIQQRGRFFGYLNNRFNEVRVFISSTMAKRFVDYAVHEEGLRRSLSKYDSSKPDYDILAKPKLKDWKRAFYLDPAMIPTRKKAQRLMLERARIEKDGWLPQRHLPNYAGADLENQDLLSRFVQTVNNDQNGGWFKSDSWGGNPNGDSNVHMEAKVPLSQVLDYLTRIRFAASDDGDMNSACLAIEENSEDLSTEFATVYLMAQGGSNSNFRRTRTLNAAGGVDLFQGRGEGEDTYKGDRKVLHPSRVSIQIHVLDIFFSKGRDGDPDRRSVPAIAVHLPKNVHEWAKNILKQP